jgi:hypothetical protein
VLSAFGHGRNHFVDIAVIPDIAGMLAIRSFWSFRSIVVSGNSDRNSVQQPTGTHRRLQRLRTVSLRPVSHYTELIPLYRLPATFAPENQNADCFSSTLPNTVSSLGRESR